MCDSIIFNDKSFSQYVKFHPGYGLVEELKVDVRISGKNQDIAIISEKHVVKAFKNTNKYIKKLTIDGQLVEFLFNKGKIEKKQISKSDYELDMTLDEPFKLGEVTEFELTFKIRNEFIYEKSWFYGIESPTKKIEINFKFGEECNISNVSIKQLRALGEVEKDFTSNVRRVQGNDVEFQCDIDFPSYRDRYKFIWS